MLVVGNKRFSKTFVKSVELLNNTVVVTFFLGHKLKVEFKSNEIAESEYSKAMRKLKKSKDSYPFVN